MTCSLRLPVPPPVTPLHPPARPVTENVAPAERIAAEEPGMTATDQVRDATLTKKNLHASCFIFISEDICSFL